jgi:hypothetical protein
MPAPPASGRIVEVGALPLLGAAGAFLVSKAGTIATVLGFTFGPSLLEALIADGDDDAAGTPLHYVELASLLGQVGGLSTLGEASLAGPWLVKWRMAVAAGRQYVSAPGRSLYEGQMAVRQLQAGLSQLEDEQAAGEPPAPVAKAGASPLPAWAWLVLGGGALAVAWFAWGRR